ncbi:P450 family sporulation-specific N-formyltyrosine oxidase Dit2 [Aspergillus brunneoviolaceus CBS 621.78]|uniref:P450 family sporulation-specific N-formyltyrosine oxidase Dit2 n=1 Tax=Aspergillus brunneoviolaceus CBS 621.78 TaxID=1450534 RepID=A0ACD1G7V7_9EURO|nr:P450 family sporulation-specific N-formyltyrosine oxidase Dit2 [Aspergillus brunneoviolaceus CBS 621.78]RAH45243.1 P450 family sporulation-specific N-formyltyrosine oxidase Dit2 [Aspergillus brunneoviolaceus CBS 621.78]
MSVIILFILAVCLAVISYTVATLHNLPAPDFPAIPPWQTLYDITTGLTRADSYDRRIRPVVERHGAVNLWHGGRWVVVVTRPDLVAQVFRNDGIFAKGGNINKLPHSTFARIFGVNIIDSHGALHDSFTEIIKPGLQRRFDLNPVRQSSQQLAQILLRQQAHRPGSGVEVQHPTLDWAIDVVADSILDLTPGQIAESRAELHEAMHRLVTGVSTKLQMLVYGVVPGLERWPWLMPSGDYGIRIVDTLEARIQDLAAIDSKDAVLVEKQKQEIPTQSNDDKLIHRMKHAFRKGGISEYHFRCNLNQLFIAAVENIDIVLDSAMWELGKNPTLQGRLREEVVTMLSQGRHGYATIYEVLRPYPPLINLINRYTTEPVCLGIECSSLIPAGTWVGWHAYGTHTDPSVWGPSARDFDPDRWGRDPVAINNMFRSVQVKGKYLPFTTHARRCLASKFAITVLKVALCELLLTVEWERDPEYKFELVKINKISTRTDGSESRPDTTVQA